MGKGIGIEGGGYKGGLMERVRTGRGAMDRVYHLQLGDPSWLSLYDPIYHVVHCITMYLPRKVSILLSPTR